METGFADLAALLALSVAIGGLALLLFAVGLKLAIALIRTVEAVALSTCRAESPCPNEADDFL